MNLATRIDQNMALKQKNYDQFLTDRTIVWLRPSVRLGLELPNCEKRPNPSEETLNARGLMYFHHRHKLAPAVKTSEL